MVLGDWAIDQALLDHIHSILPQGKTVLEFGSGEGTAELLKRYKVYSVEHNKEWLDKYPTNYIYAPLKEHKAMRNYSEPYIWYDADVLRRTLPKLKYDLILIDGPIQSRTGFVKYMNWIPLNTNVPMVFDDVNLKRNWLIIKGVSSRVKRPFTCYNAWKDGKDFGVIMP